MAYVNLPPNLQNLFYQINDRLQKLETGPNQAMYTAETASAQSTVAIFDAQQAYAQAVIAGNQATQASLQAGVAQTTADGKNTVHYSTSAPGSTANKVGDIWYQYGTGTYSNQVIAQWSGAGGTSWTSVKVSGLVIANIDAGTIKTGTLTSIAIYAGSSGQFQVSAAGALTATAASIQGTITANTLTTNSGTIGGFTITSSGLNTANITLDSGTSNISTTATTFTKYLVVNGATLGSYNLAVSGSGYFSGGVEVVGNLAVDTTSTVTYNSTNYNYALIGLGVGGTTAGRFYKTAATSSRRFKNTIEPFIERDYLNIVNKLEPVTFHYNADIVENPEVTAYGLIAEDVLDIGETDDLVNIGKDNLPESIAYDRIPWYVIKAIQQLTNRVKQLEGK